MSEQTKKPNHIWLMVIGAVLIVLIGLGGWMWLVKNKELVPYTSPKGEIVKVKTPRANETIESPLEISGEVRGSWSFEANLPATLTDSDGKVIVEGFATLQGDWMTTDYVPFKGVLNFARSESLKQGYLILKADNPSGLAAQDDAVKIPVRF